MLSHDQQREVPLWNALAPPPPPPGPPPRRAMMSAIPPPPPPPPPMRSPRKQRLKAAPSLEDTVASTFTSGNSSGVSSMSYNLAEERRRAARAMYAGTDPVEMARLENATVTSDMKSQTQSQFSEEDDQVWDPVLMDRLSVTTEESMDDFSETRWQKPEVKSPKKSPIVSSTISPVSPRGHVSSFTGKRIQQTSMLATNNSQSPGIQRSPLSEKQEATDIAMSREKLRGQQSLVQSFSVETSQSAPIQPYSVSTDGSSIENKADDSEQYSPLYKTTLSSIDSESVIAVSPRRHLLRNNEMKEGEKGKAIEMGEQDQAVITPDKKKNRTFLKKFMGVRGKDGSAKESKNSPSAIAARQVNGKLVSPDETISKIQKVKKLKKKKRRKANLDQKIGAPLDLKPGMSYMSTPNSAEIVVRRSVVESQSSEEDQSEENVSDPSGSIESDRRAALTVSTDGDDHDVDELDIMESFSQPEFDDIEALSNSSSFSPASHDITLPSDQDRRFRQCNEAFSNEEMSAITDPTFVTSIDRRTREVNEARSPVAHTKSEKTGSYTNADPLGHYWGTGRSPSAHSLLRRNVADPFSKPFFADQANDMTSPMDNGSKFADVAVDRRINDRHQIEEPSHPDDEFEASPRHEIAARRSELMERRKSIKGKARSQLAAENATFAAAASPVRQRESVPTTVHEQHTSPQGAGTSLKGTSRLQTSDPYGDRAAFSALSATIPLRGQAGQGDQTPAPHLSTSLLIKLQGRKVQTISSPSRVTEERRGGLMGARLSSSHTGRTHVRPPSTLESSISPQRVDLESIALGLAIKRRSRELCIMQGKDVVVRPQRKKIVTPRQYAPSTMDLDESKIKDPIKRAGLRLLAKAAVPIQCEIRRFLAQQAAVDRLWAIIELQSYFRRWKCEAFLLAHKYSAAKIQAGFRGWQDRDILLTEHFCAIQIQKVARTFLVSVLAYDRLYRVILVQSAVRGFIARRRYQRLREQVILIQRCYRGSQARLEVAIWHVGATIIQSAGRTYLAQLRYQFDLVDIIIVQSVARRWLANNRARREVRRELDMIEYDAATEIQAAWRGFKATTDFIFALADIIILQRSVRQWLALKELKSLKQNVRAVKIQALWRGYKARMTMLYSLVDVIIVQSVVRRHLAYKHVRELPAREDAAAKIQSAWRGFSQFSHYLISQFELVKLQAAVRGHLVRSKARLRLGCIIILQATMRKFLVRKELQETKTKSCLLASSAFGLRETIASKRIQSFWRDIIRPKKEKAAALTIERFFIMVKAAVDLEVLRHRQHRNGPRRRGRPAEAVDVIAHHDDDVSDMTSPSNYRRSLRSPREDYDEICMEEAWEDTEIHEARKQRLMEEDYLQRYGLSEREYRRRRQHPSARESPRRHRGSSGTPRERRSPHVEGGEFVSPRERRTPSRGLHHMPSTTRHSNYGRFWSEEDRYRKERMAPSARTYRPPKHYEETDTMRSEFSPHSSRARHGHSKGHGRNRSTRESPNVHDEYEYEATHQRSRSRHRRHESYEESPRMRTSSREGGYRKRAV